MFKNFFAIIYSLIQLPINTFSEENELEKDTLIYFQSLPHLHLRLTQNPKEEMNQNRGIKFYIF